jgi:hypothetical protein
MSYRDFTFPDVVQKLGLTVRTERLFADVVSVALLDDFRSRLDESVSLATALNTEKARSEFILAPIFLEFRRLSAHKHGVFSGVEFNVDQAAGLNGYCDFLITRSPMVFFVTAPVVAVAEAKNNNLTSGLGQCVAEMRAAWLFNQQKREAVSQVFGATTTGTEWRFLRLRGTELVIDETEHSVRQPGLLMAILIHMAETA